MQDKVLQSKFDISYVKEYLRRKYGDGNSNYFMKLKNNTLISTNNIISLLSNIMRFLIRTS